MSLSLLPPAIHNGYLLIGPSVGGTARKVLMDDGANQAYFGWVAAGDVTGLAASAITDTTNAANITSGTLDANRLPTPTALALGAVKSISATAKQYLTSLGTNGVFVSAQPQSSDLSDITTLSISTSGTFTSSAGVSSFRQMYVGVVGSAGVSIICTSDGNLTLQNNAQSANANLTFGNLLLSGEITRYNNVNTVGFGVPAIVAQNRLTAQTAPVASVCTFTPAADGTFEVTGSLFINSGNYSSGSVAIRVAYTDENNVARSGDLLPMFGPSNILATGANSAGAFKGFCLSIRAKGGSAITVLTNGTFGATYNVDATIKQIA